MIWELGCRGFCHKKLWSWWGCRVLRIGEKGSKMLLLHIVVLIKWQFGQKVRRGVEVIEATVNRVNINSSYTSPLLHCQVGKLLAWRVCSQNVYQAQTCIVNNVLSFLLFLFWSFANPTSDMWHCWCCSQIRLKLFQNAFKTTTPHYDVILVTSFLMMIDHIIIYHIA